MSNLFEKRLQQRRSEGSLPSLDHGSHGRRLVNSNAGVHVITPVQAMKVSQLLNETTDLIERVLSTASDNIGSLQRALRSLEGLSKQPEAVGLEESFAQFEGRLLRVFGLYVVNLLTDEDMTIQERILEAKRLLEDYLPVADEEEAEVVIERQDADETLVDPLYEGEDVDFSDVFDKLVITDDVESV